MKTRNLSILIALSCIGASAAANYDLLGRKGSQMNSPMVYKNVNYKAPKGSLEESVLAKQVLNGNAVAIEGIYDENNVALISNTAAYYAYSIYEKNTVSRIAIDGYKSFRKLNSYFIPVYLDLSQKTSQQTTVPKTNTKYTVSFSSISSLKAASPYIDGKTINYSSKNESFLAETQDLGFFYGALEDYDEIGIYIPGDAEPAKLSANDNTKYVSLTKDCKQTPKPEREQETSLSIAAINAFAKKAAPFVINTSCGTNFPDAPEEQSPQILVGLHTQKDYSQNSSSTSLYGTKARDLDNFIYNNRTIEIVGAGNFGTKKNGEKWNGDLAAEAHAANAITVGSVDKSRKIEITSSWKNPTCSKSVCPNTPSLFDKPELYNFTNYHLNDATNFYKIKKYANNSDLPIVLNGTRGAAALTAAMVTDLLSDQPFLRWHPEVVKARLLTSAKDMNDNDKDNSIYTGIPSHRNVFGFYNSRTQHYYHYSHFWNGDITKFSTIENGKRVIKLTLPIIKKYKYRVAIAWLSSGNDIYNLHKIPQDFDLAAYFNSNVSIISEKDYEYYSTNVTQNRSTFIASSQDKHNPYEFFEFTAAKDGYVTFVITLAQEDANSENKGQAQLGLDFLEIHE